MRPIDLLGVPFPVSDAAVEEAREAGRGNAALYFKLPHVADGFGASREYICSRGFVIPDHVIGRTFNLYECVLFNFVLGLLSV